MPYQNACSVASVMSNWKVFVTLWTIDLQASSSLGFLRQGYWSVLPGPPLGNRHKPGIEPVSPVSPELQAHSLALSHQERSPYQNSVQFSWSVVSDYLRPHGLWHARLPCPSHLLELAQTHVHWVDDTIQPSHPLSSPSPSVFHISQHQGLFRWVGSSHHVAKVLEFQLQHQSF